MKCENIHNGNNEKVIIKERYNSKYNQPWMINGYFKDISKESKYIIDHYEILSFSEWASPTDEERSMRNDVIDRLKKIILSLHPNAEVRVYGSFESDLCVPQSDIDLVVLNTNVKEEQRIAAMTELAYEIHKSRVSHTFPSLITTTKVPIIKFVDSKTGYLVDINFDTYSGINNTILIKQFLSEYPLLRPLAIILKYYLKQCHLNDPWTGGIGSYALLILITSFLQLHTPSKGKSDKVTENENLAVVLINLLKFYGKEFDYKNLVISIRNGGSYLTKKMKNWENENFIDALSVEDPQNPENDVGRSSFGINQAKISFLRGYNLLTNENFTTPHDSFVSKLLLVSDREISSRNEIKRIYSFTKKKCKINNTKRKFYFECTEQEKEYFYLQDVKENSRVTYYDNDKSYSLFVNSDKQRKNGIKGKNKSNLSKKRRSNKKSFTLDDQHFPPLESLYSKNCKNIL